MAKTHFSGPLVVGGKQLTDNTTIAALDGATEAATISAKVDEIIQALIDAGVIKGA